MLSYSSQGSRPDTLLVCRWTQCWYAGERFKKGWFGSDCPSCCARYKSSIGVSTKAALQLSIACATSLQPWLLTWTETHAQGIDGQLYWIFAIFASTPPIISIISIIIISIFILFYCLVYSRERELEPLEPVVVWYPLGWDLFVERVGAAITLSTLLLMWWSRLMCVSVCMRNMYAFVCLHMCGWVGVWLCGCLCVAACVCVCLCVCVWGGLYRINKHK